MSLEESQYWDKVYHVQAKLIRQFLNHNYPDVSLIDIGYAPDQGTGTELIVVRIHVMKADVETWTTFPEQVDGVPVRVVPVDDYRLSTS